MPITLPVAKGGWVPPVKHSRIDAEACPDHFHSGQREVWFDERQDIIACAGTQGGKTEITSYWLLREIQRTSELAEELGIGNYIYAGPTLSLLDAQAIPAFEALFVDKHNLGKLIKGNKPKFYFSTEGAIRLTGKPTKLVVHFAYTNDSQNLESMTALAAGWDETGQPDNKEASFEAMNRRLEIARSRGFGRRLMTTTPYDWTWFKRRVVDFVGRVTTYGYHSWPSWLNPRVSEAQVRSHLDAGMPLWRWEMMYEAKWTRPAGAVFDCYDDRVEGIGTGPTNVVPTFDFDGRKWRKHSGHDFGSANTAAVCWWESLEKPGYYVIADSYKAQGDDEALHAERLKQKFGSPMVTSWGGQNGEKVFRRKYTEAGFPIQCPVLIGAGSVDAGYTSLYRLFREKRLKVMEHLTGVREEVINISYVLDGDGEPTRKIADESKYHRSAASRYIGGSLEGAGETTVYSRTGHDDEHDEEWDDFWDMPKAWVTKVG